MINLSPEWTRAFPDKPFPKAKEITLEHLDWADRIIKQYTSDRLGR